MFFFFSKIYQRRTSQQNTDWDNRALKKKEFSRGKHFPEKKWIPRRLIAN